MGWVLPNLELSHKKDNITKESNPIPKELGFFILCSRSPTGRGNMLKTCKGIGSNPMGNTEKWPSGVIGSHASLRNWWEKSRVSSTLTLVTYSKSKAELGPDISERY